jgi:RNA polymerase sigma-70 factor, ECF subfamily
MRRISSADDLPLEGPENVLELDPVNGLCGEPAGPKQIVAALFEQQRLSVCRYLTSLGLRPQVASEIAQESFLRLYRHLRSNGKSENLRGWVFRVAHNLAMNELTRAGSADGETPVSEADPAGDPEQVLLHKERMRRMRTAIRMLPRRQQECLHLRAEGLRYREIAQALGIATSSVAESVQRALETLARTCHE